MLLKKKKDKKKKNYIEAAPATHKLKTGEKIHLFKTHFNVHEYIIYLRSPQIHGYVYPGVKGLAEVGVCHHRGGSLCSVLSRAGQPQAPRPGLTPGAAREAPGGSPGTAASVPTTTPPRLFLLTVGVDTFRGQRLGGLICYSIFSLVLQYSVLCRFS